MTHCIAVATLHLAHVGGLGTVTGHVAISLTIATGQLALVGTIRRLVAFLAAVAAGHNGLGRAIFGKVAHLLAVLALDVVEVRRSFAVCRAVSGLLAIATEVRVGAGCGAIAQTMANSFAIVAKDLDFLAFNSLSRAVLTHVAEF